MTIANEIAKYIELTGHIKIKPTTGITLVSPTIDELCDMYRVHPIFIMQLLSELNITTGMFDVKRKNIKKRASS